MKIKFIKFNKLNPMNKGFFIFILIIMLVILFLMPSIFALGITPGRTTIDFSPNLEREVQFSVVNTENKDMNIAFSVEGVLADYITINNNVASFTSLEKSKSFNYNLKLPRGLSPGLHKANIIALELPPGVENSGTIIQATVSVVTQVYVFVPYPGKYIEASLDIVNKENTNEVNFYIPFISRGEEKINSVKAVIDIYKENEKIASLNSNELSAESKERKELSAVWNPDIAPGEYNAIVNLDYDGKKIKIEKKFNIGLEDLGVLGVSVNDFKLGDVAKIKILVQNKLSDAIKGAFSNLKVYSEEFDKIVDLKSESYEILKQSNKEMVVYWDTENLEKGIYDSELNINYDNKFINKNFKIDVDENSMSFTGVGFVVANDIGGKTSMISLLFIIIGFLVLINFVWLVWWMRKKSKKN